METKEPKWKTPLLIVLSCITGLAIIYGIFFNCIGGFSFTNSKNIVTGSIDLDGKVESIEIDLDIGDISIEYGDKASIDYECPEKLIPKANIENGVLEIKSPKNVNLRFKEAKNTEYKYVIIIPKGTELKNIEMDMDCGNIEFNDIKAGFIEINADLGNVELGNIECSSFEVVADLGNIEIKDSTLGNTKAKADLGSVEFKNVAFDKGEFVADMGSIFVSGDYADITAKCSMGAVNVETDRPESEVKFDLKADMGSVTINGKAR